jgi:hypothetical protein
VLSDWKFQHLPGIRQLALYGQHALALDCTIAILLPPAARTVQRVSNVTLDYRSFADNSEVTCHEDRSTGLAKLFEANSQFVCFSAARHADFYRTKGVAGLEEGTAAA